MKNNMLMWSFVVLSGAVFAANPVANTKLDLSKVELDCVTDKCPVAYRPGEPMTFTYTLRLNQQSVPRTFYLRWDRSGDDGQTDAGVAEIAEGKPVTVTTSIDRPGFVRILSSLTDAEGNALCYFKHGETRVTLGYDSGAGADVDTLLPACDEPSDYTAFWDRQLKKLAAVPVKPQMTELSTNQIPEKFRAAYRAWAVSVPCAGPRPCTGFLVMPRGAQAKSLKATCSFDGYGPGNCEKLPVAWDYETADGGIFFHINAHGYDLLKDKAYYQAYMKERPNYGLVDSENENPETAYFLGMALRVVRAFDFVKTLPEWNGRDLRARGGSQGGLQTTWAGDLVKGLTVCEPWVTWCTDINGCSVGRLGGWRPAWQKGLAYFDTVIHTRHIPKTCELRITRAGLGDYCCPPSGLACQYNAASCPKSIVWVQSSTHGFVPEPSVKHAYTNVAPAGAAISGRATRALTDVEKGPFVKAAFDAAKWTLTADGETKAIDFSARTNLRKGRGKGGVDLKAMDRVTLKGELVAEADGLAVVGAGFDWWWTAFVNGEKRFGRSFAIAGGNIWGGTKGDWTFTAPVRKGANEIVFEVVVGEGGFGEAAALDPASVPDGVDAAPRKAFLAVEEKFPSAESVPFAPEKVGERTWRFKTAQAFPAGYEWRKKGLERWCPVWDGACATEHTVTIPEGDVEWRPIRYQYRAGWSIARGEIIQM